MQALIEADDRILQRLHDAASSGQRTVARFLLNTPRNDISRFWEIKLVLRIRPALDVQRLDDAFKHTIRRHPELSSIFHLTAQGTIVVRRIPLSRFSVSSHDCQAMNEDDVSQILHEHSDRELNPRTGPLVTLDLYRIADGSSIVLLRLSHLVADGRSTEIVLTTLMQSYLGLVASPGSTANAEFEDFVDYEDDFADSDEADEHIAFWRTQLLGWSDPAPLPEIKQAGPEIIRPGAGKARLTFDALQTDAIKAAARNHGVSLFVFLLTSYFLALVKVTGRRALPIRSTAANRSRREFLPLVGYMSISNCIRIELDQEACFLELLLKVAGTVNEVLKYQNSALLAYERLFPSPTTFSGSELDQFHFQAYPSGTDVVSGLLYDPDLPPQILGGLEISSVRMKNHYALRDITVGYFDRGTKIIVDVSFKRDVIDANAVDGLLAHFDRIVSQCAKDPLSGIGDL